MWAYFVPCGVCNSGWLQVCIVLCVKALARRQERPHKIFRACFYMGLLQLSDCACESGDFTKYLSILNEVHSEKNKINLLIWWSFKLAWFSLEHKRRYFKSISIVFVYTRGHQTWSWRAGVLQSLAPTCLNTPAWKFEVYLLRPWLSASGVFD